MKPTRCTNFSNLFSTCFGQFLCPSSGVFYCTYSNGICHTGLLTACEQAASCQQTCMTYTIIVCTVKCPDDGQGNCPKHVENKLEKLVHLVGFIIRNNPVSPMKITVFWEVTPYSLLDMYTRFGRTWCLHL